MQSLSKRLFSSCRSSLSHIGSSPVFLTPDVKLNSVNMLIPKVIPKGSQKIILNSLLSINGPNGEINLQIPDFLNISNEGTSLSISINNDKNKIQKSLWGTYRSLINNAIIGVTDGHSSTLRFQGTGYRVNLETIDNVKWVKMKVGRCNVEGLPIPNGITCETPSQTLLVLKGANKQKLNLFAARLRNMRPPEPYKGKGIYFNGETIKLKAKKVK
ncbi:mitochondrial 54S ribosomal protein YmL16 [Pichia kluyveri]|uniref:Mitochondrial 54S ribosomal protein YmL16 n=1 Tax=Pichia kluyveri TaxID=36015 RepID=A0AAV5R4S3_PICKL|nr:mitochondrial 54S ribosomal protein YmL16 [Pichia kluyveri]